MAKAFKNTKSSAALAALCCFLPVAANAEQPQRSLQFCGSGYMSLLKHPGFQVTIMIAMFLIIFVYALVDFIFLGERQGDISI